MISNTILVCLVIVTKVCSEAGLLLQKTPDFYKSKIDNANDKKNREELSKIIQILNNYEDFKKEDVYKKPYIDDTNNDKFEQKPPSKSQKRDEKAYKKNDYDPEVRIHLIRNPEVLDDFVKNLRSGTNDKYSSNSVDSSVSVSLERTRSKKSDIRRNAEDLNEKHDSTGDKEGKPEVIDFEIPDDMLKDQVTPFEARLEYVSENPVLEEKQDVNTDDVTANTKRFKIKKNVQETTENLDETKPNDDDLGRKEEKSRNRGKEKEKTDKWEKATEKDAESTSRGEFINYEDWNTEKPNKKDNLRNDDKSESRNDDRGRSSKSRKEDFDRKDSYEVKSKYDEDALDKNSKNRRDKNNKSRSRKLKGNSAYQSSEIGWDSKADERSLSTKNSPSNFEKNHESKSRESDKLENHNNKRKRSDWDAVGRPSKKSKLEESTTKKKKVTEWSFPKESNNEWDKVGRDWGKPAKQESKLDRPRSKRQKMKSTPEVYEKSSFVARIPEYRNHNRPRSYQSFQGRTPIPFVGKHGIYDDKK